MRKVKVEVVNGKYEASVDGVVVSRRGSMNKELTIDMLKKKYQVDEVEWLAPDSNIRTPRQAVVKPQAVDADTAVDYQVNHNTSRTVSLVRAEQGTAYVPAVDQTFEGDENFRDLCDILKSGEFVPTYVVGNSGLGKTMSAEQACAKLKRKAVMVSITAETDDETLMGGFRLVDGNTVFQEGPVIVAMREGAVLILDEVDAGHPNKILCLQAIANGQGYYIKRTGDYVVPSPGFMIISTANTKGKGADRHGSDQFIGTSIQNEAFLDRHGIWMYQNYPTVAREKKILVNNGCSPEYAEKLCIWAETIRKSFEEEAVDQVITTRRLVQIVRATRIFKDPMKAITKATERFDINTRDAFLKLWDAMNAEKQAAPSQTPMPSNGVPF
jgi:MoxR-like ATPase